VPQADRLHHQHIAQYLNHTVHQEIITVQNKKLEAVQPFPQLVSLLSSIMEVQRFHRALFLVIGIAVAIFILVATSLFGLNF
jgi:hypothetical protein